MPSFTSKPYPSMSLLLSFILIAPLSVSSRSVRRHSSRAGRRQEENTSESEDLVTGTSSREPQESPSGTESSTTNSDGSGFTSSIGESPAEATSSGSETSSDTTSTESTSSSSSSSSSETSVTQSSDVSPTSDSSSEIPSSSSFTTSSPTSTRVSLVTSTPVVTQTVDESTFSSSPTTESADSSSRSSFPTHIKVPSDTASTSSPVTTLVVAPSATGVTDEFASATNASATPTPVSAAANANNGFWDNKPAVGGTFAVVAVVILVAILFIGRIVWNRRRARAETFDEKFVSFAPPATHYRDQSFGVPRRSPSPPSLQGNPLNAYNQDAFYETAAYYDAESSDHSHSHESSFRAYPALAQAPTNVYLPAAMTPSTTSLTPATMRPSTAQSQNPFADSNATFETSPFADPPQAGNHLRVPIQNGAYPAGRISSLYTASDADSFYGDSGARAV